MPLEGILQLKQGGRIGKENFFSFRGKNIGFINFTFDKNGIDESVIRTKKHPVRSGSVDDFFYPAPAYITAAQVKIDIFVSFPGSLAGKVRKRAAGVGADETKGGIAMVHGNHPKGGTGSIPHGVDQDGKLHLLSNGVDRIHFRGINGEIRIAGMILDPLEAGVTAVPADFLKGLL